MNTSITRNFAAVCVSMSLFACLASGPDAAVAAEKVSARSIPNSTARSTSIVSNTVVAVEVPESVFIDLPQRTDPFFPHADYRKTKTITPAPSQKAGGDAVLNNLKLTGFGGIGNKRWAMINGVSIYQGEDSKIRLGNATHSIVCLEMKENSVIVGIKDSPARRELKLDN